MSDILRLEVANAIADKLWLLGLVTDSELSKIKEANKEQIIKKE